MYSASRFSKNSTYIANANFPSANVTKVSNSYVAKKWIVHEEIIIDSVCWFILTRFFLISHWIFSKKKFQTWTIWQEVNLRVSLSIRVMELSIFLVLDSVLLLLLYISSQKFLLQPFRIINIKNLSFIPKTSIQISKSYKIWQKHYSISSFLRKPYFVLIVKSQMPHLNKYGLHGLMLSGWGSSASSTIFLK